MRRTKTIKIDDREITVKELRVRDIRLLMEQAETSDTITGYLHHLPLVVDLTPEEIEAFAPSELQVLWEAFADVNSVFLDTLKKSQLLPLIKQSVLTSMTEQFHDLSNAVT